MSAPRLAPGASEKRCNQCWQVKPLEQFSGRIPGRVYQDCTECRTNKYAPVANHRTGLPTDSPLRVLIQSESRNEKLGPIPAVYVTASTCPPSCVQYNSGCYAESHLTREHWRRVESDGVSWGELCLFVARLPEGQLWRYAVAGDLPGVGETVEPYELGLLIYANSGRRGFAFSHKRSQQALTEISLANELGFTVNLSADNLREADYLSAWGPVAVVLPSDAPDKLTTPEGRKVLVCAYERGIGIRCSDCGLCAVSNRRQIIGFRAHGLRKREVSERARLAVVR